MKRTDFLSLVNYLNESWRGFFTSREKKELADDYYYEYKHNKNGSTIEALIDGLLQDAANGSEKSIKWLLKLTA